MEDVQKGNVQNTELNSTKRKASGSESNLPQFTSRNPPWTYLKLQLHVTPLLQLLIDVLTCQNSVPQLDNDSTTPLDALTARTYLSSALSQYLGVTGTSISIDILKIEHNTPSSAQQAPSQTLKGDQIWIRIPCDDAAAVVAALSSWVGGSNGANFAWRVLAKGNFLGALAAGSGADLFSP